MKQPLQGLEERQLLENIAIAVPLVLEATDDSMLTCRLDARSGRASIESMGTNSTCRAVHMTAQAGECLPGGTRADDSPISAQDA